MGSFLGTSGELDCHQPTYSTEICIDEFKVRLNLLLHCALDSELFRDECRTGLPQEAHNPRQVCAWMNPFFFSETPSRSQASLHRAASLTHLVPPSGCCWARCLFNLQLHHTRESRAILEACALSEFASCLG